MSSCSRCGVRSDVGCKHQKATGDLPASLKAQEIDLKRERFNKDGKVKFTTMAGLNFHRGDIARNLERGAELLGLKKRNDR